MAKRKRKPHHPRPQAQAEPVAATRTAERPRSIRAERKDLARRQREEMRRRMARNRLMRTIVTWLAIGALIGLVLFFLNRPKGGKQAGPLPGMLTGAAPWSANTADAGARLDRLNLPPAGSGMHIHADLQIYVNGKPVTVPADVGLASNVESPLHTHATDGIIHIESQTVRTFTLGEFFDVWGVRLTQTCLGGYCDGGDQQLRAYVDGRGQTGGIGDIPLVDHEVIVLTYGTRAQEPKPVPATFDWSTLNP